GSNIGNDGARSGIEIRIALVAASYDLLPVEARPAALENFVTRGEPTLDSRTIFALTFRRHFATLDRSSAPVCHKSEMFRLHVWQIVWSSFARTVAATRLFLSERRWPGTK